VNLFAILSHIRFKDVIDILFLVVFAYHLYLWFYGTKAFKALVGLLGLGIIYTAAQLWDLFLTTWMFQILWQVLVILLIILFQSEIRQVLERLNPLRAFGWPKLAQPLGWVTRFSEACFLLAKRSYGALIILERTDRVDELITGGTELEGEPDDEILLSVFQKGSPLHDGAVLVRDGKIIRVGTFLPLSSEEGLPSHWGTRHRAAVGLSEKCDAWVVAVSEERSEVSLARSDRVTRIESSAALAELVTDALRSPVAKKEPFLKRLLSYITRRWRAKLGSLALVSVLWLVFAGQQNFEVTLQVPVELTNLPDNLEIVEPLNPRIAVTLRGLRKDASTIKADEIRARIDLTMAAYGWKNFRIIRDQVLLPNEQVAVVRIEPSEFTFDFQEKPEKTEKPASNPSS
jgi:uncharacterized protein (TIGR00159 family)